MMKDIHLYRLMFLLALLAAVAATPLRLVEAASDQARALAERYGDPDIEPVDGGVGDDSGETIRGEVDHSDVAPVLVGPVFPAVLALFDFGPARLVLFEIDRPPRSSPTLARRLAMLQRLLI